MTRLPTTPDVHSRARRAGYDPDVLAQACVLVVGAGALGQNTLLDLALSGVRELRIVDGDSFEPHNRSRSPLHPRRRSFEFGDPLPKASTVGRELLSLHVDDAARIAVADAWIEELGLGVFEGVDVIAACADALEARSYLAEVAMLLKIPIVDGGFSGANLGMSVYPQSGDPRAAPCWACAGAPLPGAFSCEQYARYAEQQHVVPAIQNGAAALGAMCAEAIINVLHGRESNPRRVALDLRTGESRVFEPRPDGLCAGFHRRFDDIEQTDLTPAASVADTLSQLGNPKATIALRDVFVERANCPRCQRTCDIGAPSRRWQRDARCAACGGPWTHAPDQIPNADTIEAFLGAADPRSALSLQTLGYGPGDVVELAGGGTTAIRLAGGADDVCHAIIP